MFTQSVRHSDGTVSIRQRDDRPALLVSSTSWTLDEDFSILLGALLKLQERQKREHDEYPKIIAIVTGTGPQTSHYLPLLKELKATHLFVGIQTLWLEVARLVLIMSSKTSADWVPRP